MSNLGDHSGQPSFTPLHVLAFKTLGLWSSRSHWTIDVVFGMIETSLNRSMEGAKPHSLLTSLNNVIRFTAAFFCDDYWTAAGNIVHSSRFPLLLEDCRRREYLSVALNGFDVDNLEGNHFFENTQRHSPPTILKYLSDWYL